MKTLKFICSKTQKEQILEEVEFKFLYSILFKFSYSMGLEILDSKIVSIQCNQIIDLHTQISKELSELLTKFYHEPDLRKRSKFPGRYEKIYFENNKYVVDYTMSRLGRLLYTLSLRLVFLEGVMIQKADLIVSSVD